MTAPDQLKGPRQRVTLDPNVVWHLWDVTIHIEAPADSRPPSVLYCIRLQSPSHRGCLGTPGSTAFLAPSFPGVFFVVVWCFLGKGQAQACLMCSVTKDDEGCLMSNQVQGPSDKRSKALKCKPKPNLKRERDKMGNNPPENIHHSAEGDDVWV